MRVLLFCRGVKTLTGKKTAKIKYTKPPEDDIFENRARIKWYILFF